MKFAVVNTAPDRKDIAALCDLNADVIILSFDAVRDGSLFRLLASSGAAECAGTLSEIAECTVVAASPPGGVCVANGGKALGEVRTVHNLCGNSGECEYKVFDTGQGKLGILSGEDIFFPECARILAVSDSDFLVCAVDGFPDGAGLALRANSFANGLNGIMTAAGSVTVTSYKGEIVYFSASEISAFEIDAVRDRTFLSARRTDTYRPLIS